MNLLKEVLDLAKDLRKERPEITAFEALQIATKIQHNRVLGECFLLNATGAPSGLEAIAMQLGAGDGKNTIADGLNAIASAVHGG